VLWQRLPSLSLPLKERAGIGFMKHRAFSLLELLVVITVVGILAALLLPSLGRTKSVAQRTDCIGNLRQFGLGAAMYWDDSGGQCFRISDGSTNSGTIWWFGWLDNSQPEGQRPCNLALGKLHPYLGGDDTRLCPSMPSGPPLLKLKSTRVLCSYGYNGSLSAPAGQPPVRVDHIQRPSGTAVFADAAQANDFQAPATRSSPILEEWYYLDFASIYTSSAYYGHGHFRHARQAAVAFVDGHVDRENPLAGSLDRRLPAQCLGQLRPEILILP